MEEISIKEEVTDEKFEDKFSHGCNPDKNLAMFDVKIKEEPDDTSSVDGAPFEEITIKTEKIEPYGMSDDNCTDAEYGSTTKTPLQTQSNAELKKDCRENSKKSCLSSNAIAVLPCSKETEKCAVVSQSDSGNGPDCRHTNDGSLANFGERSVGDREATSAVNVEEASAMEADLLCSVVADLNAPALDDYVMLDMDENHPFGGGEGRDEGGGEGSKSRTSDPAKWVSVAAKKARNFGEEYVSPDGSVVVKARKMGPGCNYSCRYKCHHKLADIHRQEIFSEFWKMGTHSLHWDFISKHVKVMKKKTSTSDKDSGSSSRRQTSRIYYFRVGGEEIQVCKTMFTHTLGVWDQWIETAIRKSQTSDGATFPDLRGKHTTNANRSYGTRPAVKASVIDHIQMFKPVHGRDSNDRSSKQYLEEGLTVSCMHKLYQEWMAGQEGKAATLRQYRDTFNTNFNLSFFVPKVECDACTEYKNCSSEDKLSLEESYQEHVKRKTEMKELKASDTQEARTKGNTHIGMACFDLQKVLFTPQCTNPMLYYKHKLCVWNWTVCDVGAHAGYCYVWHESVGRRTRSEIASLLLHYVEMKSADGVTDFRFYCHDGYGLNKGDFLMAVFALAAAKFSVKIRLRFLLRGHSHNETDNMHNLIEKRGRDNELYVPDDWIKVMESAKNWRNPQGEASKPYTVIEVSQDMLFDFTEIAEKLNLHVDENGVQVPWYKVWEMTVDNVEPACFTFKCQFSDPPTKVRLDLTAPNLDLKAVTLRKAYNGQLPIAQVKLDDLLSLCSSTIIPSRYHQFYRSLKGSSGPDVDLPESIQPKIASNSDFSEEHSLDSEEPPSKKTAM